MPFSTAMQVHEEELDASVANLAACGEAGILAHPPTLKLSAVNVSTSSGLSGETCTTAASDLAPKPVPSQQHLSALISTQPDSKVLLPRRGERISLTIRRVLKEKKNLLRLSSR
jgi:hypothetical protein